MLGSAAIFTGALCVLMTSFPTLTSSAEDPLYYRARVRVYVDKSGVDEFMFDNPGEKLTHHIEKMVERVNTIYESLLPKLNVTLQLEQVIPLDKDIFTHILTSKGNKAIYVDWTGYEFWKWTKNTYDQHKYDLAILFTGFEMYSRNLDPGSFGHGYQGSACTVNGVGAVEIQEPAGTIGMAHEIGHILGASHDEDGPASMCGPGSYKDGNLMNTITKLNSPLRFQFSDCSRRQIQKYILDLDEREQDCLIPRPEKNMTIPALEETADEVCAQAKGAGWVMHRSYDDYTDFFCEDMYCVKYENGDRQLAKMVAPNGLKCGKSKRCFDKKCLDTSYGDSTMTDYCPWGSQSDKDVTEAYGYPCKELGCGYRRLCCGMCGPKS